MTKKEVLDGKHWLIIAKYPYPGKNEIYDILESEIDPLDSDEFDEFWVEIIDDCVAYHCYLDADEVPVEEDFDSYDGYQDEINEWYANKCDNVEIFSRLINQKLIDEYGEKWFNVLLNE